MSQKLIAAMPKDLDLEDGTILRVTAISPTTGAVVSGVTVSNTVITAIGISHGAGGVGGPDELVWKIIYEMPADNTL